MTRIYWTDDLLDIHIPTLLFLVMYPGYEIAGQMAKYLLEHAELSALGARIRGGGSPDIIPGPLCSWMVVLFFLSFRRL